MPSKTVVLHYTPAEARDFFARLAAYSAEYVRVNLRDVHSAWPSRNRYPEWGDAYDGAPIGALLHYTAGTRFSGTIRHFVKEHRASSNWVVAKALDRKFDELRRSLDLDRDLRAEVSQVVPPEFPAWHGGWVNRFLAGIEVRNAGILRPHARRLGRASALVSGIDRRDFLRYPNADAHDLRFYWWPEGWSTEFRGEVTRLRGSWWETWSRGSVATVIVLLRYLNSLFEGSLRPEWLLAHHHVSRVKNDCVLLPNLAGIREAALYDRRHVDEIEWLAELDDVEDGFEYAEEPWQLSGELAERQGDRAEEDLEGFDPVRIEGEIDSAEEVKEGFRRFGYFVGTPGGLLASVRTYQRSRGLAVDGIAGPRTRGALERELRGWRLLEAPERIADI